MAYREKPVEKLYYTIGEVSRILNVPVSTVRFWENQFEILKPGKNKKGNRLFMPGDLQNLKKIHYLLKEQGMTIAGAKKHLAEKADETDFRLRIRESLLEIRELLVDLRNNI
ncbi:MAG TPA: MerR family transcriptional regulator [Bacteroidales bacterium]|nr:MerR family transcriptional regulator [Bacteroidales bacterium]